MAALRSLQQFLAQPPPNRKLGPFVLVHQLGKGGFAPVWLAREVYGETELRTAAVKLFSLHDDESGDAQRIVEEARLLCQVEHPNVVRFLSLAVDEARGLMGLAMEHLTGRPLSDRLLESGPLSFEETVDVGCAIASALSSVHRAGLVHRDVKPQNLVEAGGQYKLIDFGIASARRLHAPKLTAPFALPLDLPLEAMGSRVSDLSAKLRATHSGIHGLLGVSGTMGYVDPACLSDNLPATEASDLYSLGATLFECLVGRVPSFLPGGHGLSAPILDGRQPAPAVRSLRADVPAQLAALVDRLLSKERSQRPRSAEQVAQECSALRAEMRGKSHALPPVEVGPFRGLLRFETGDRGVYFGRSIEVARATDMLRSMGAVTVVGPSGSGKSSLARAGILPAIEEDGLQIWPRRWDPVVFAPGRAPDDELRNALAPIVPAARCRTVESCVLALSERAEAAERGVVILVDQAEELVTLAGTTRPELLLDLLARTAGHPTPFVRWVVAVRQDMLDALLMQGQLGRILPPGLLMVGPLTGNTWAQVVDQALAAYGHTFEDEALREQVLADLRTCGEAMPLAQFALHALWERRDPTRRTLTWDGYRAVGGVFGALQQHADAVVREASGGTSEGLAWARRVLLEVTTARGTRRARSDAELLETLGSGAESVARKLEQGRLLVREPTGLTLAHDTLARAWPTLRNWVDEARQHRELLEQVEADAVIWAADRDPTRLWKKRRLALALEAEKAEGAGRISRDFLRASRRAERRALVTAGTLAGVVAVASMVGLAGYVRQINASRAALSAEKEEAQRQRDVALHEQSRAQLERERAEAERLRADLAQKAANEAKGYISAQLVDLQNQVSRAKTQAELEALQRKIREAREAQGAGIPSAPQPPPARPTSTGHGLGAVGDPP